jgi:hypothetical protein
MPRKTTRSHRPAVGVASTRQTINNNQIIGTALRNLTASADLCLQLGLINEQWYRQNITGLHIRMMTGSPSTAQRAVRGQVAQFPASVAS